jgi:hypothetical protein
LWCNNLSQPMGSISCVAPTTMPNSYFTKPSGENMIHAYIFFSILVNIHIIFAQS